MTSSTPPEPQSSSQKRRSEEFIAVAIAFLSFAGIFYWAISQGKTTDLSSLLVPLSQLSGSSSPVEPSAESPGESTKTAIASLLPTPSPKAIPPESALVPTPPTVAPLGPPLPKVAAPFSPAPSNTMLPPAAPSSPEPTATPEAKPSIAFSDVPANYWAAPFITVLLQRGILQGFPDQMFQPNRPVTRAEFAVMLKKAFDLPMVRPEMTFKDISANSWASSAIASAVRMGFMNGYAEEVFQPNQAIPKHQALIAIATGLKLAIPSDAEAVVKGYEDAAEMPRYAIGKVAAATQAGLVVNYPRQSLLSPQRAMTRADTAALIYQALVHEGKAAPINSPSLVSPKK